MGSLGSPVSCTDGDAAAAKQSDVIVSVSDRLVFWATGDNVAPGETREADGFHFFSLSSAFCYEPFNADFGPFKLSLVYRYCVMLHEKMCSPALANMNIVHYCSLDPNEMANVACMLCMYQVVATGVSAEAAFEPFKESGVTFKPYCDALAKEHKFNLTIPDVLHGLERSIDLGWFNWRTFDLNSYELLDRFDMCGLNWVVPGKLMAFAGPCDNSSSGRMPVKDYVPVLRATNVKLVIRLNSSEYDREELIENGIDHLDLPFADGSCPSPAVIRAFIAAVDNCPGAVAVHCKAGLGRTGTLIGLYAMRHYCFTAREFIGWSRLCRPGCVLGAQQPFLVRMEAVLLGAGVEALSDAAAPTAAEKAGDEGQGDRLCAARAPAKRSSGGGKPRQEQKQLPVLLGRQCGTRVEREDSRQAIVLDAPRKQ